MVVVAPLTDATRGLFDDDLFARWARAPTSSTSPGARSSTRTPCDGPSTPGSVAAASVDTTDPEPLPEGHWMYDDPRVRLSPHVSWSWPGAFGAMYETFAENLRRYLAGEPLRSVVDPAAGY